MIKTDDPEYLAIRDKILNVSQRKEQEAWEAILSTEPGRRVLWQLMDKFGLYDYVFDGNGQKMAEKAAKQGCAQFIRNQISFYVGGEIWMNMEREQMIKRQQDDSEIERQTKKLDEKRGRKPNADRE